VKFKLDENLGRHAQEIFASAGHVVAKAFPSNASARKSVGAF